MAKWVESRRDVTEWIANNNPGGVLTEPSFEAPLAEAILTAPDRPAWRTDWEPWLDVRAEQLLMGLVSS